jgi:serine/threonine protein kinase
MDRLERARTRAEFFCRMEETFADQDSVNFIFEYCPGQDLFWLIQNEMNLFLGKQSKKDWVKFYAAEILLALEYMHQQHIIYRDLKPENVVIDVNGHIKVIDFGFAKKLQSSSNPKHHYKTYTNCGTLGYTAPEVLLSHGASFEADIWSFGIILCELF